MAGKNTEVNKEMTKLLEMFTETCKTMIFCACTIAVVSCGLERERLTFGERNFRKMYQAKK